MNTFSGVNKFNGPPSFFNFFESNLQVSLVSMSISVPNRDTTTIVVVSTELMENKVRVSNASNVVGSIRSMLNGPLKVGLVSMGVSVPDGNVSIIFSDSTFKVSNSVRGKSRGQIELLSGLGKLFGFLVGLLGFNRDETPFKVGLVNIVPLGDWVVVSGGCSLNMNAFVGVSKSDSPVVSTLVVKVNLQVSLVSMSISVPSRDTTTIVGVSTELMENIVGISNASNVVSSVWASDDGPLKVCLVSMGASVPDGDVSIIFANATFEVSNSVRVEGRDNKDFSSRVGEFEW